MSEIVNDHDHELLLTPREKTALDSAMVKLKYGLQEALSFRVRGTKDNWRSLPNPLTELVGSITGEPITDIAGKPIVRSAEDPMLVVSDFTNRPLQPVLMSITDAAASRKHAVSVRFSANHQSGSEYRLNTGLTDSLIYTDQPKGSDAQDRYKYFSSTERGIIELAAFAERARRTGIMSKRMSEVVLAMELPVDNLDAMHNAVKAKLLKCMMQIRAAESF